VGAGSNKLFGFGQLNAREYFDDSAVVFFGKPRSAGLHEHLVSRA
jgi:hypothetical protein